ncbi:MAG TPA: ABC transporter permease [Bryobacteraceae bacterium]|nr:ABC transporter permease [Bryobacteraceae bacterium]
MNQNFLKDLRHACRTLWLNPGFTAIAVLSLALGIGVNTAIFSLIDTLLLRTLPVEDPSRLVMVSDPSAAGVNIGTQGGDRSLFTREEFSRMRERNQVFTDMLAAESDASRENVSINGGSMEEMATRLVSENYFSTLGVKPLVGRTFTREDEKGPGSDPYAVISYAYWKKRFGLDASVLGKTIQIHKAFLTVIGVMPPRFFGETVGQPPDAWLPMMMEPSVKPGRDWLHDDPSKVERVEWLMVAGRLKPGVSEKQAESSLNVLFQQVIHETAGSNLPPDRLRQLAGQKIKIRPGDKGASPLREDSSEPLLVLMAVVFLVLLIACANVANLLLARSAARQREMGIRLAIGASRSRLIGQLLTESFVLALLGGTVGVLFAFWTSDLLLRMVASGPNPVPLDIHPDFRLLAFTAGLSILTGLVFGLAPAFRGTRVDVNSALKENSRSIIGSGARISMGKALVVSQVAISLSLLVGAGLFLRTLQNLQRVHLGYPRERLLLVHVDALAAGYQGAQRAAVFQNLLERFRAMPGVRGVTVSENGLFSGNESGDQISVEGYKPQKKGDDHARWDQIGPNYFSTIGIPMLLGREIGPEDAGTSARVCVINESMAHFYFGSQNPIGRHVTDEFPDSHFTFQIVGVSKDDRDHQLRGEIQRRFYIPFFQGMNGIPEEGNFEIRTFADPNSLIRTVRQQVEQVDRSLPVQSVKPLGELLDERLTQERLLAQLCVFFGALALVLASVGLYGVLSYSIARRTNEIGIRMALGAQQGTVLGMVLRETALVVGIGIAIGVPVALALTRLVSSKLYGLTAADPLTVAAASLVLAVVAMFAGYLPARRASRVDPLVALRYE